MVVAVLGNVTHFLTDSDAHRAELEEAGAELLPPEFEEATGEDTLWGAVYGVFALPFEDVTLGWENDAGESGSLERVVREARLPFVGTAAGIAPGGRACLSLLFGALAGVPGFKVCF